MGLAGRKNKQRIGTDPRNLTWSDDSSKFGAKYLQSLGWSSGSGLGASGEGRTTNLNIHQKLDLMGIGANRKGPGGDDAGWRGGREFEGLLARLNQAQGEELQDIPVEGGELPDARNNVSLEVEADAEEANGKRKEDKSEKRKRKRSATEVDEVDAKVLKRRKKEEKREKKEKKRAEKAAKKQKNRQDPENAEGEEVHTEVAEPLGNTAGDAKDTVETVKAAPRFRAHRARHLASKRLAAASSIGMNEILGIATSASSGQSLGPSSVPFPVQMTPPPAPPQRDEDCAPGFGLARIQNRSKQAVEADDAATNAITSMGLGARSAFGGGLGFGGARDENGKKNIKEGGELMLTSQKSVGDYFAEKMRLKGTSKQEPAPVGTAAQKAEEPKRKGMEKKRK